MLVLQHDQEGAVGVVLNRPSAEWVTEYLPEWAPRLEEPAVVFVGGPVEPAVAIGVVRNVISAQPTSLSEVGMIDLAEDPAAVAAGPVRVFSGYAGWGAGQLEAELAEGAWMVVPALADDVFTERPLDLWTKVLQRQGGSLALMATYPSDPSMN